MIISFKMIHQVSWSKSNKQTRLSFDRDKPRNLEFELWFIDFGPLLWTGDGGVVAHKILVTSPEANFGLFGALGFVLWTGPLPWACQL